MVEDGQSNLEQFRRMKTTSEDLTRWRESISLDLSDGEVYELQVRDGPDVSLRIFIN